MSHIFTHSKIDGALIICLARLGPRDTVVNTYTYFYYLGLTFQWGGRQFAKHTTVV